MAFGLIAFLMSLLLLGLCYMVWWRRLLKRIPQPSAAIQASPVIIEQLEQSIGGQLPGAVRNAYVDGRVLRIAIPVALQWHGIEYVVDQFMQANADQNRRLTEYMRIPPSSFIFAGDDFGNYYIVKANDNAVYFWDHDDGNVTVAFESADDFWNALQASNPPEQKGDK